MQKLKIISVPKDSFRKLLNVLVRDCTFAHSPGVLFKGTMLKNIPHELKDIAIPGENKIHECMYIDYPMKYPVSIDLVSPETIYDLFDQVKVSMETIFENKKEFYIPKHMRLDDLYISQFTVCTNGDIVVYINS